MESRIRLVVSFALLFSSLGVASAGEGYAAAPDAKALQACVGAIQSELDASAAPQEQELVKRITRAGNRYEYWINSAHGAEDGKLARSRAYCHVKSNGVVLKLHLASGLWDKPVRRPMLAAGK